MKRTFLVLAAIAGTTAIALLACNSQPAAAESTVISQDSLIKRGSYLVSGLGCDDCHTSKKMGPKGPELDMEHRFGGHLANIPLGKIDTSVMSQGWVLFNLTNTATVGPWGISYAANISSDETGIGSWSEDQFKIALRKGKYKGMNESRPLMPPMPWQNYGQLNDDDLKAIFAFLKSTKPVNNVVPAYTPPNEMKVK
ncbi:MAG: c-type cytochrome [Sphingobacteriales bacterium]|nr:c-type cytochrome [Sphingobacteriales bacterium]OJW35575.1 MAG: diheme cytochrome c-553 [Sphingobacteriales bacterium 46-32]